MTSRRQKYRSYHFCIGSVCLDIFFENLFMYLVNTSTDKSVFLKNPISFRDV